MRPERTAVTGAGRALGAALLERLREAGGPEPLALEGVPGERAARRALRGCATVVHLAPDRDPQATPARRAADLAGTRALLAAARPAGVRRVVLVTSTEVHRAAPGQVPLSEDAEVAAPADETLVGAHVETERLADHARRTGLDVVVLRPAALGGVEPSQAGTPLRSLAAGRLLAVRGVEPLWQLCHAEDLVAALLLAVDGRVRGAAAVASEGFLEQREVERLSGRRRLELPAGVVLSTAERLQRLGVAPGGPGEVALLLAPVVVETRRLREAGWRPAWSAQEVLLEHLSGLPAPGDAVDRAAAYAAGTAGATVALVGTAALVRAARRRRRR